MAFIYRSFLVLVVAAIAWFSYVKHIEGRDRALRVQDLRDCFDRREFAQGRPSKDVQSHYLQALVRLHEAQIAERSLGWWKTKDMSLHWYIAESLKNLEANTDEGELISRSLQEAYFELQRHDALASSEVRQSLAAGRLPAASQGIFAGDPLVVGYRISPAVLPQLRNHPGNFILQPATVWALQQDLIETATLGSVHEFVDAGVLTEIDYKEIRDRIAPPTPPRTADKND